MKPLLLAIVGRGQPAFAAQQTCMAVLSGGF
jgi:hypothetical protein